MVLLPGDDTVDHWKPVGFKEYLTIIEVARIAGRDRRRITQLEAKGAIAAPIRVKVGTLKVRLYTAEEAEVIRLHFQNAKKPGRPKRKKV